MKSLAFFLFACALAVSAMASRQFPPPSFVRSLPEAAGETIAGAANRVFIANAALGRVAVVDEASRVTTVAVGPQPRYIVAVGFGFMTSNAGDGSVSLSRDLATASTIPVGGSGPMLADDRGRVFLLRPDGFMVVIDVATFTARTFDTGARSPVQHAVSSGRLAVADASGEIRVFNTAIGDTPVTDYVTRVAGRPVVLAWLDRDALDVLVEGAALSLVRVNFTAIPVEVRPLALPALGRGARAAKIVGGTLFVGFSDGLLVFKTSNYTDFIPGEVVSIDVDPAGRAFVLDASRNLRVIETRTLRMDVVSLPSASTQLRYLAGTCSVYAAGAALSVVRAPCGDGSIPQINMQALWWVWDGSQSGWGLNVAHQGNKLFATWFTYDANGQPTWLVVSDARSDGGNQYSGDLYRTTGPAFNAPVFDPARVTRTPAGTAAFSGGEPDYMIFVTHVDGRSMQFPVGRQLFSSPLPMCDSDVTPGPLPIYQDLWWNPAESGWGVNIAHQGNILFVTWFTYDTDGKATWFVGSDVQKTGNATYSGTLYKTFGPPMTASPWDASKVTRMPVGSVTLTFRDDDNGTFAYTVNGISGSKAITRQVFASPVTRCR